MTKNVLTNLFSAARELLGGWPALGVLAALYAALLGACYLFMTTREATVWQVLLTALLAVAVPVLLLLLLAGSARTALGETRPLALLAQAAATGWKLFLVSLPLIALALLFVWGTNKLEDRVKPDPEEAARAIQEREAAAAEGGPDAAGARPLPPVRWKYVAVVALKLLLLGVVLPLLAINVWLAVARDGLVGALRRLGSTIARAFAPQSALTYAVGLILFALIPYFLLHTPTRFESNWLELTLFSLRLLLAFAFTLFGWTLTLRALAQSAVLGSNNQAPSSAVAQG